MGTRLLAIFLEERAASINKAHPVPYVGFHRPALARAAVATAAAPSYRAFWATAHQRGYRNAGKLTRWSATPCWQLLMSSHAGAQYRPDSLAGSEAHGAFWKSDVVRMGAVGEGRFRSARLCLPEAHENNIQLHAWLYPFRPPRVGRPRSDRPFPPTASGLMVSYAKRGLGASTFTGSTLLVRRGLAGRAGILHADGPGVVRVPDRRHPLGL